MDNQYNIDPNQQVNENFLGSNQYGEQQQMLDDDEQVNANGMFNADRLGGEQEPEEPENDEYFDDAGDIGYLPADHVSFNF